MTNVQTVADRLNQNVAPTRKNNFINRETYITRLPEDVKIQVFEEEAVVAYSYVSRQGYPSALIFTGRGNKPTVYSQYRTEERRDQVIQNVVSNIKSDMERKAERKMKRSIPHTFMVDDILYSSWGYDQTNIDFYQVTKLVGKTMIEIRPIRAEVVANHGVYDDLMPIKNSFFPEDSYRGGIMRKKVNSEYQSVTMNTYANAYKWNGKPQTATNPMFGR